MSELLLKVGQYGVLAAIADSWKERDTIWENTLLGAYLYPPWGATPQSA